MGQVLKTAWRCALLDRRAYASLQFDNYATANAVLLVAAVALVESIMVGLFIGIGGFVVFFLSTVIQSLVGWAASTGGLWLAATKLFGASGRFETALRMTGYAWLPFLLLGLSVFPLIPVLGSDVTAVVLVAVVWYGAGLFTIGREYFELESRNAAAAAVLGVAGWLLVRLLF